MYVGSSVGNEISTDFKYVGEPFLMGTVAMGMYCMKLEVQESKRLSKGKILGCNESD